MNQDPLILAEKAARLVYFGIEQRRRYAQNLEFKDLLKEYEHDSQFKKTVDSIATGLQVEVLEINQTGVYLRPQKGTVFSISLTDVNRLTTRQTDRYIGLILVALAAYYFPKDMDFQNAPLRPVTIFDLDEYIRETCKKIKQKLTETDVKLGEEDLEQMAISYLQQQPIDDQHQSSRSTSLALIRKTFKFLERERLFTKYEEEDNFLPTARFTYAIDSLVNNSYLHRFLESAEETGGSK